MKSHRGELVEGAEGLNRTKHTIGALLTRRIRDIELDMSLPRPGAEILSAAFIDMHAHALTQTQQRFIGQHIVKISGTGESRPSQRGVVSRDVRRNLSCRSAERYFADISRYVQKGQWQFGQDRVSVYHDWEGTPLLLRKSQAEASALSLVPISIGEVVLPAGTIVAVDNEMNSQPSGSSSQDDVSLESYLTPDPLMIVPLRLSGWAYEEPLDRAVFSVERFRGWYCDGDRLADLQGTQIEDFAGAARKIMNFCAE